MASVDLIQDFAILLLAAGLAGALCRRLGLSVIVGYLIAGVVIGPHTPPFSLIVDEARILALSQVGLVFLMFSIGLGLSLTKFGRLGLATVVATVLGAFLILNLTELFGFVIGWSPLQAMFVAAMLMVSSSAVIAKIVHELRLGHERSSQLALAVTVLEDVVAVVMLTLLASQAETGPASGGLGSLLGGLSAFVVLLLGGGLLLVPRLLRRLEARADPEMQTVIVAGVLFLLALAAAKAGYSIALGAFLFGAVVAEIPQKAGVERSFSGLRDMFSSVFFVSIGMMIDLRLLLEAWPSILALTAFALIARPIACGLALILVGTEPREARRAGLLLTPLGEFSFIIAQLGVGTAVLSPAFYPIAVGASILTVLATPLVNRHRERLLAAAERLEPRWIGRTLDAYHVWLHQVRSLAPSRPVWSLLRGRVLQMGVELLFISGLLIYSGRLQDAIVSSTWGARFEHGTLAFAYWSVVSVLVLVPLVAIWRNGATVALIVAESLQDSWLPPPLIERSVKASLGLGLGYWLYVVWPKDAFTRWGWVVLAAGGAILVTVFSRRLIYWHSEWQNSVREVLATPADDRGEMRAQSRAALGESLGEWNLALADVTVPDPSAHQGETLARLGLPARFGCAVVEIERNGHAMIAPGPDFALYPGDRLLLLGEPAQLKSALNFLGQPAAQATHEATVDTLVLDTVTVGAGQTGRSLAELRVGTHFGVRVVGIQRDDRRLLHPGGPERLQEGDRLLLLGTLARIRQARRAFAAGKAKPSSAA